MTACPTCRGTGDVPPHVAYALATATPGGNPSQSFEGATCSCDGPPHPWTARWCPATGPVTGRRPRR